MMCAYRRYNPHQSVLLASFYLPLYVADGAPMMCSAPATTLTTCPAELGRLWFGGVPSSPGGDLALTFDSEPQTFSYLLQLS